MFKDISDYVKSCRACMTQKCAKERQGTIITCRYLSWACPAIFL